MNGIKIRERGKNMIMIRVSKKSKFSCISLASSLLFLASSSIVGAQGDSSIGLSVFNSSSEPIKITSDRLDVFDKESKAVFIGNVIAVQGDTNIKCTRLEVFYSQKENTTSPKTTDPKPDAEKKTAGLPTDTNSIEKINCIGPATITSKTQVATGDNATFDKAKSKVYLTGNVTLNDGPNVTKGERLVYDTKTGIAKIEGGRVKTLIVPGSTNTNLKTRK